MKKIWNYIKGLFGPTLAKPSLPSGIIMTMKNGEKVPLTAVKPGVYESSLENGVLTMTLKKDENSKQ